MSSVTEQYVNIVTYLQIINLFLPSTQEKENLILSFIQHNKLCHLYGTEFFSTSAAFELFPG